MAIIDVRLNIVVSYIVGCVFYFSFQLLAHLSNFEIWARKTGPKSRASPTMGPQNHVFPSILYHISMDAQFHPVFIFQLCLT